MDKFYFAYRGIRDGFLDFSIRTQWVLALLAVIAGVVLHLTAMEWIVVIVCIGCVITAEMLNTCIERICDMFTSEFDERVKYIKDLAAGAVFVSSLMALICALIILMQHIAS